MTVIRFGAQVAATLEEGAAREWLVTDGLGGYAMGTVAGLATRKYHGLLVVATQPPAQRHLALAALDPLIVMRDGRLRLGVHEWASGAVDPAGYAHLASFALEDGVPRWRWCVDGIVLEREVAMARGRAAVGVLHRVVATPGGGPVRLELAALSTWRDVHGERSGGPAPSVEHVGNGFVFEDAWRAAGPGWRPGGDWYWGAYHREEAALGMPATEDLWWAGTFVADLHPGEVAEVTAWSDPPGSPGAPPPPARVIVAAARARARQVAAQCRPKDETEAALAQAADQLIVSGPAVIAGYPWFGEWSRDTLTSYEGLFLETGRQDEGRALLIRLVASLSEGMVANTSESGAPEYNTADATMWLLHAIGRHVERAGDLDLAARVAPALNEVIEWHLRGTRYGLRVDPTDGLLTQGAEGMALTWMDARVQGAPVTQRAGKPVEIEALWINGLGVLAGIQSRLGRDASSTRAVENRARQAFLRRFPLPRGGLFDVVDGPGGDDASLRPNQLLAVSLPLAPVRDLALGASVVKVCATSLLTPLGLRTLAPGEFGYRGRHRGSQNERDLAYHQGTTWPWLMGSFVEASLRTGVLASSQQSEGLLDGLDAHIADWGVGSVSETAEGDAPHAATGCPFQAWSVAELLRIRRLLTRRG